MFAYCNNNPVNYYDIGGRNADAIQSWSIGMGWLPFADAALPIGDIVYWGGLLLLGAFALDSTQDNNLTISMYEVDVASGPPSPNDDDDEDDYYDDYYDDDSNFGGRQKMGKKNGSTPGNNQAQNRQFRDATRGLSKQQQEKLHREISHQGGGFHDIVDAVKNMFVFVVSFFANEE